MNAKLICILPALLGGIMGGWTKTSDNTWTSDNGTSWTKTGDDCWTSSDGRNVTKTGDYHWEKGGTSWDNNYDDGAFGFFEDDDDDSDEFKIKGKFTIDFDVDDDEYLVSNADKVLDKFYGEIFGDDFVERFSFGPYGENDWYSVNPASVSLDIDGDNLKVAIGRMKDFVERLRKEQGR